MLRRLHRAPTHAMGRMLHTAAPRFALDDEPDASQQPSTLPSTLSRRLSWGEAIAASLEEPTSTPTDAHASPPLPKALQAKLEGFRAPAQRPAPSAPLPWAHLTNPTAPPSAAQPDQPSFPGDLGHADMASMLHIRFRKEDRSNLNLAPSMQPPAPSGQDPPPLPPVSVEEYYSNRSFTYTGRLPTQPSWQQDSLMQRDPARHAPARPYAAINSDNDLDKATERSLVAPVVLFLCEPSQTMWMPSLQSELSQHHPQAVVMHVPTQAPINQQQPSAAHMGNASPVLLQLGECRHPSLFVLTNGQLTAAKHFPRSSMLKVRRERSRLCARKVLSWCV